jgi:hypothetical protein
MSCDNLLVWKNNSRQHYGIPASRFVVPTVRVNGQFADIPAGYKIPRCDLEQASLYQSGLSVATSAVAAFTSPLELYVPANAVVGGERFRATLAFSVPVVASSTDTVTLAIRIADDAGAAVSGTTTTILTLAVPTSGSTKFASVVLEFYYDATDSQLHLIASTRSDTTYATTVLADINFDIAAIQRIQLGVTQSDISHSEVVTFLYGTIGRLN